MDRKVISEFQERNFHIPTLVNPIRNSKQIVKHAYPTIIEDQSTSHEQNVHDITVSGSGYGVGNKRARLALPIDLSESAGKIPVIPEDANLSSFESNVLNLVE